MEVAQEDVPGVGQNAELVLHLQRRPEVIVPVLALVAIVRQHRVVEENPQPVEIHPQRSSTMMFGAMSRELALLRGNRNDTQTLPGLLHTLRRRFGIQEATFVFDGGMSSRINLEAMNAAHLG